MVEKEYLIKNLKELELVSNWLKSKFEKQTLVLLEGPLGVGKTALIKKIAVAQGYSENKVKSPTFSLINNYKTKKYDITHIDLYRLDSHDQLLLEEIKEYLDSKKSMVLIEWPEKMDLTSLESQARQVIKIDLSFQSKNFRKVSIYVKSTSK